MPYVLGKVNPSEVVVRIVQLLYQLPCIVAAAIVYQQHEAVRRYLLFRHQSVKQSRKSLARLQQNLVLIIARTYYTEFHHFFNSFIFKSVNSENVTNGCPFFLKYTMKSFRRLAIAMPA